MKPLAKCKERSAKSTELLQKRMKQGHKGSKLHALYSMLCAFFIFLCFGHVSAPGGQAATALPQEAAVITGLDVQDNAITVTADKPFIYTIYKPGDPYKIVVDLPEVSVGAFSRRIVPNKAGITEILPSQIQAPSPMARLDVILENPSTFEQDYRHNVLTLKIAGEDPEKQEARRDIRTSGSLPAVKRISYAQADNSAPSVQRAASRATEITDVSFDTSRDDVKVLIRGNGSMTPNVFPLEGRIVIDISGVIMNADVPSTVFSPVSGIRAAQHEDMVRIVLDLKEKTGFDVAAIGDSILVTLKGTGEPALAAAVREIEETHIAAEEAPRRKEPDLFANHRCQSYVDGKENVNFDFQDQDIVPILRLFADISGCNLFVHPDVKGKATMKFRNVPWDQALDTLLRTFSLGKIIEANIIRVAPMTVFAKESEEKIKALEASVKAEPLETKIFPVSYADVAVIENAVRGSRILTPRGSVSVDKRTSSMLIKDVASVFPEVDNLLATLDRPTPQVLIEGRIVEVNTASSVDLGIQWGVALKTTNTLSSFGGLSGVPSLSAGPFTGNNFLVDFPAKSAAPLSGSGFSFGVINPAGTVALDMQLSALQTVGKGKVISNPKILTIDNGRAKILQGKSIPVRKLTAEGTVSTEFKDITMELNVTPHITPDGSIAMSIEIKKEELDPTVPSVEGVPGTDKKEANTNVIIRDGETVVIGGMYKVQTTESDSGVPGLMKIPILGWLFKNRLQQQTTNELLIFITPRIVEKP
jgi:type IV pilus assembly protein PilQ